MNTIQSMQCTQAESSLLINGVETSITVQPGQPLTASVRCTSCWCPLVSTTFRIIASSSPLGSGDVRVDSGEHILGADGCGASTFSLNVLGTYTLRARVCCSWLNTEHCVAGDTDMSNNVIVRVQKATNGGTSACDPTVCPADKNLCILGICVPKDIAIIGGAALLLLMLSGGS